MGGVARTHLSRVRGDDAEGRRLLIRPAAVGGVALVWEVAVG